VDRKAEFRELDFLRILVRAARLSRSRPSFALVVTVCIAIAGALASAAMERFVGWPDALTLERMPRWPAPR
jgi:hypothetical protein